MSVLPWNSRSAHNIFFTLVCDCSMKHNSPRVADAHACRQRATRPSQPCVHRVAMIDVLIQTHLYVQFRYASSCLPLGVIGLAWFTAGNRPSGLKKRPPYIQHRRVPRPNIHSPKSRTQLCWGYSPSPMFTVCLSDLLADLERLRCCTPSFGAQGAPATGHYIRLPGLAARLWLALRYSMNPRHP